MSQFLVADHLVAGAVCGHVCGLMKENAVILPKAFCHIHGGRESGWIGKMGK